MSMSVKMMAHADLLHVVLEGKFELDDAKKSFLRVMEAVNKDRALRVLIDGRTVTGEPTLIERYIYGEFAANVATWRRGAEEASDRLQFAYVLVPPTLHRSRLGETVAADRGMNIRAFDNLPDAIEWLNIDPKRIEVPVKSDVEARAADHK